MSLAAGEKKLNLYERVYLAIKNGIIRGEFAPGQKLTETKLAELLNASRTPVREALRRLEIEGLVVFYPSQGAEVTSLSEQTITHLYECRSVLEGLAAKKAVQNMNEKSLMVLEESIFLARKYFSDGEIEKVVEKNTLFHDTILQSSCNLPLSQMMGQIRTQILRYRSITSTIGFRSSFLDEHMEIYHAIGQRDSHLAEECMKQHVLADLGTILEGVKPYLKEHEANL